MIALTRPINGFSIQTQLPGTRKIHSKSHKQAQVENNVRLLKASRLVEIPLFEIKRAFVNIKRHPLPFSANLEQRFFKSSSSITLLFFGTLVLSMALDHLLEKDPFTERKAFIEAIEKGNLKKFTHLIKSEGVLNGDSKFWDCALNSVKYRKYYIDDRIRLLIENSNEYIDRDFLKKKENFMRQENEAYEMYKIVDEMRTKIHKFPTIYF